MPTRRAHNKTRLGCSQCKRRRIKCDGEHPTCANCKKRGLECSFLLLVPSSRLSTLTPSEPETTPEQSLETESTEIVTRSKPSPPYQVRVFRRENTVVSLSPPASPSRASSRSPSPAPSESSISSFELLKLYPTLNLKDCWRDCREKLPSTLQSLLNHYEFATSLTLATDDPAKSAWENYVPELATKNWYLVHGVLAVASLHLSRLHDDEDKKSEMLNIAADQMNRALALYRPALENVEEKNASALFACATLTALFVMRTATLDIEETLASMARRPAGPSPQNVTRLLQSVCKMFYSLRGTHVVLRPGWKWLSSGRLSPVAVRKWWPKSRVPASERAMAEDRRLCQLEGLWIAPGRAYESHFGVLTETLALLRETYALISQLTLPGNTYPTRTAMPYTTDGTTIGILKDRGAMMQWPVRVPRDYMRLFESGNREALVLGAYYAVLIGRVRNVWWLEGMGAAMIMAIAAALGPDNWHLIEWPAQTVGVDLAGSLGPQSPSEGAFVDDFHMNVI